MLIIGSINGLNVDCEIFDPIWLGNSTKVSRCAVDSWHDIGLITWACLAGLPHFESVPRRYSEGLQVRLSSGMSIKSEIVELGVKVGAINITPVPLFVVDGGPADLLLGSDFLRRLMLGSHPVQSEKDLFGLPYRDESQVEYHSTRKFSPEVLGVRFYPARSIVAVRQVELLMDSLRILHNAATVAFEEVELPSSGRRGLEVAYDMLFGDGLEQKAQLRLEWIESGSIWTSLASGSKSGLAWLSKLFNVSVDAKLKSTVANANSAEEEFRINERTREDVVRTRQAELNRTRAKNVRETHDEWRTNVLSEIDFRKSLADRVTDTGIREMVLAATDQAIRKLVESDFLPVVEHLPESIRSTQVRIVKIEAEEESESEDVDDTEPGGYLEG